MIHTLADIPIILSSNSSHFRKQSQNAKIVIKFENINDISITMPFMVQTYVNDKLIFYSGWMYRFDKRTWKVDTTVGQYQNEE